MIFNINNQLLIFFIMGFFKDFKASLLRGDILSLATAVVIGASFGKIVTSAVDDLIMPLVGLLTGGMDFTKKFIALDGQTYADLAAAKAAGASVITYGNFVQAIINFVIIAFIVFTILRAAEKSKKKDAVAVVPAGPSQEELLTQIRDLLKK